MLQRSFEMTGDNDKKLLLGSHPFFGPFQKGEDILRANILLEFVKFVIRVVLDPKFILNSVQHFNDPSDFVFGEQPDMQVEFGATIRLRRHSVLANEDKSGEENRFERDHHRQEVEWEWVERLMPSEREIVQNPRCESDHMEVDKSHVSRENCDDVRYFLLEISLRHLSVSLCAERSNIVFHRVAERMKPVVSLGFRGLRGSQFFHNRVRDGVSGYIVSF